MKTTTTLVASERSHATGPRTTCAVPFVPGYRYSHSNWPGRTAVQFPERRGGAAVALAPLVGEARLKVLLWKVYDSALYTPSGRWRGAGPYQLSLTYLRDIPVEQLIKETRKAWDDQNRVHQQQKLLDYDAQGRIYKRLRSHAPLQFLRYPKAKIRAHFDNIPSLFLN